MTTASLGKKFEQVFLKDWKKSFPNTFIYRLPDQVTGYKITSQNPSDFLAYNNGLLWLLECKETKEGTLNFSKVRQLDLLKEYIAFEGVYPYIIVWFSSFDKVLAVPVETALKIRNDGKKSISLKMLEEKSYNIIEIPSIKKRTFLESDYTILLKEKENDQ